MKVTSVAVIGIGAMGGPMARRLQAAGFELTVCDRDAAVAATFARAGASVAPRPEDCAGADVILVVVSTAQQVKDVVLGERGILAGVTGERSPIVVVMSTVSAETLDSLAQPVRAAKVRMIDAPISGGPRGAEQGTLTMLTGGDEQDIRIAQPVFEHLATKQIHCGRLGNAQTMKILNNTLGVSVTVIAGEVYRLGIERGLNAAALSRVLEACSGRTSISKEPAGPQAVYADLARDRAFYQGIEAIMRKDLSLAVEMASGVDGEYPALHGLKALIDSLGEETFGNWRRVAEAPRTIS